MFKDERITKEISTLKRSLLFIFSAVALLTIILKLTIAQTTKFSLYAVEITSLITCVTILILDKLKMVKDEREEFEKNETLDQLFKYGIIIIYFVYSLITGVVIGSMEDKDVLITPNNYINICLFFATFITLATFKYKNIYLNYSFIQESNRDYFKKVLLKTLKIFAFIFLCLTISFIISILLNLNNIINVITLFISYVVSLFISGIMLCGIYLIFSIIERVQYKLDNKYEENPPKATYITIGLEAIAICLIIILFVTILKLTTLSSENAGVEIVTYYQSLIKTFRSCLMIVLATLVCYYYGDYAKRNKNNHLRYFLFGILGLCFAYNIKEYLLPYLQLYISNKFDTLKQYNIANNYNLTFSIINMILLLFSLFSFCKVNENKIINIGLSVITLTVIILNLISLFKVIDYKFILLLQHEFIYLIFLVTSLVILTIDLVKTSKHKI